VTIGSILGGAFRLFRERPGAVLIWTLIYLAMTVASSFVMTEIIKGQMEALYAGASEATVQLGIYWRSLLVSLAGIVVTSVLYAAAQRAVLRPREGGPGFLRLGMDEVRTFLLTIFYLIIFVIATIVLGFIVALFMGGAGPQAVGSAALIVLVLIAVMLAYFGTKLSLTYPVTIIRESFAIGEGWSLTDGRFWTLFGAYLILFLILLCLTIASLMVTDWDYLSAFLEYGINSPQVQQAALREYQQLMMGEIDTRLILTWGLTAVQGGISLTLGAGAVATAAKELTADEDGLTETFS
jgi:hypothetical protein